MKKLITIALSLAMFVILPATAYAAPSNASSSTTVFEDGSYIITTISEEPSPRGITFLQSSSKSGTKTIRYYTAGNTLEWDFSVIGTFTYDGVTAIATAASASHNIYVSGWTCAGESASYSGNTAYASATFRYLSLLTKNTSTSLSCSPNGTLS